MKVTRGLNSCYTLLNLISGKEMDFHVSDMKLFVLDSAAVDPLDIARRDCREYFVDKILQHRGNPTFTPIPPPFMIVVVMPL